MTLEDIARLRLEIDAAKSKESLEDLKQLSKDVNRELRDMEATGQKGSEGWQALKLQQREVTAGMKEMARNVDINNASLNELTSASRQLHREIGNLKTGSEEWIDKMKRLREVDDKLNEVKKQIRGIKDEADDQESTWTKFKGFFTAAFAVNLIVQAGEYLFEFGKDVLDITAKFEKYNAILKTTLGSTEAGAAAFDMIQKFAAKTNFSVDEMTDSYIKLANRGLRPTQAELMKVADVANATGKPFGQLTEAINDINNTDRWNDIGIKAQTAGNKVSLTFKGVTKEVERTEAGVLSAVVAFGEINGVAGMTATISNTLAGQMSNLGDNSDRLKNTIGTDLAPSFKGLIGFLNQAIDAFIEVWNGTVPVRDAFMALFYVIGTLGTSLMTMIRTFFNLDAQASGTAVVIDILNFAFRAAASILMSFITIITAGVDTLNVLWNTGKRVANFFGAEFKIDPKANFDTLQKNFKDNEKAVDDIWKAQETGREKTSKTANENIFDLFGKTEQKKTDVADAEAKKQAEARKKAEEDAQKKIEDLRVAAIKDENDRQVAAENLRYQREVDGINKSLASQALKKQQLELAKQIHEDKLTDMEQKAEAKREKEAADVANRLATLRAKLTGDDLAVKMASLDKQRAEDEAYVRKTVTDQTQLHLLLTQINDKFVADVDAAKLAQQQKEDKRNRDHRDKQLREEKTLFDAQFQAEVAKAEASLGLTRENSQAQWDAKRTLLEAEAQYRAQKLRTEAEAEKNRINDSIADTDRRKQAIEAIDARLTAQLTTNEQKLQAERVKLQQEANRAREENNKAFFDGLEGLMKGDYTGFMKYLDLKVKNDKDGNQQRLRDFAVKGEQTLQVAGQAVQALITMNQQYTQIRLGQIDKEKNNQLAAWKSQYDQGKISKEEYESKVSETEKEFLEKKKAEQLKAWKREQAMNIAMAIINGAMAALKSLATLGWPLGLIGVAASAVAAGIQIALIKRQQPPSFAYGGFVQNGGVPDGPLHGAQPGTGGISLINNKTGQHVGEMEGGEPIMILSRATYRNNKPVVDRLLHSSLHRNGAKIWARDGAAFGSDGGSYVDYLAGYSNRRFDDGGMMADDSTPSVGGGNYLGEYGGDGGSGGGDGGGGSASGLESVTNSEIEKSQALMESIEKNTEITAKNIETLNSALQTALSTLQTALLNSNSSQATMLGGKLDTSNTYLNTIAGKNWSVSVHNVVNVTAQVQAVNNASNF